MIMRLIDADVANRWMERNNAFIDSNILKAIPAIDPLDAFEICRCKDCIYLWHDANNDLFCAYKYGLKRPKETDYCPYAMRKENNNV